MYTFCQGYIRLVKVVIVLHKYYLKQFMNYNFFRLPHKMRQHVLLQVEMLNSFLYSTLQGACRNQCSGEKKHEGQLLE